MCVFGRESLNNLRIRYPSCSLDELCVIPDRDRYCFFSSPHSHWPCNRRRVPCTSRRKEFCVTCRWNRWTPCEASDLVWLLLSVVPDNIIIFRYLCVPPKHFIHSRGRFWYGWRLLIRNVWVNRFKLHNTRHSRNYVSLECPAFTVCTTRYNNRQFYVLPTQCIYVFCMNLRINSDLCHLQHKLIGFYNRDEKCLQRGTDWIFKYISHLRRISSWVFLSFEANAEVFPKNPRFSCSLPNVNLTELDLSR
jgi:hypothetical protein